MRGYRQALVIAIASLASMLVLLAVIVLLNGTEGLEKCAGLAFGGWGAPLLAAGVISASVWLMAMVSEGRNRTTAETSVADGPCCQECESPVMAKWRVCPSCGSMLSE